MNSFSANVQWLGEVCVEMSPSGTWNDVPCDTVYQDKVFVCYGKYQS